MDLIGNDLALARELFGMLKQDLLTAPVGAKRYWEIVAKMQELANLGLSQAKRFMETIDLTRAPNSFGEETTFRFLREGPRSTSVKGARRQLQADPSSPNKTFGMRPHGRRDIPTDTQ